MTASQTTTGSDEKRAFLAGRIAFRVICVVYGLWMIFLAAVMWQVVQS